MTSRREEKEYLRERNVSHVSDPERKVLHDFTYMRNVKNDAHEHYSDLCLCLHMHAPVCVVSSFLLLQ